MSNEPKYMKREIIRLYTLLSDQDKKEVLKELGVSSKKVYKILHKPTGLFYKPVSRYDSNLGLSGKIYSKKPTTVPTSVRIHLRGGELKQTKAGTVTDILQKYFKIGNSVDRYFSVNESDWEIVEV